MCNCLAVLPDDILFLHRACHVFALALHERFNYQIVLLEDTTAQDAKKAAVHVYCLLSEGQSVDVVGISREEEALAELGWIGSKYRRLKVRAEELEKYFIVTEGAGLCAEPGFLCATRARAERRINACTDYYSGSLASPVLGLTRKRGSPPEELQLWDD